MAYLPTSEKDKENQGQQQGTPMLSATAGAPMMGMPSGGSKQGPSSSGSWTNLENYLQANRGEGSRMAGDVTGKISQQAQEGEQGLQQAQSEFETKANQTPTYQQMDWSDPTKVNKEAFTAQKNATYGGYGGLGEVSGYDAIVSKLRGAQTASQQSKTEPGRMELLKQSYQRPSYSTGQQALDQMITQNEPESRDKYKEIQEKYAEEAKKATTAEETAAKLAEQKKSQAAEVSSKTKQDYSNRLNQYNQQLQSAAQQAQSARAKQVQDELAKYGGSSYGVSQAGYVSPVEEQATPYSVASAQDLAQARALQDLVGGDTSMFQGNAQMVAANPELVGTYGRQPLVNYNEGGYQGAVSAAQTRYGQEVQPLVAQMQALSGRKQLPNIPEATRVALQNQTRAQLAQLANQINQINSKYGLQAGQSVIPY